MPKVKAVVLSVIVFAAVLVCSCVSNPTSQSSEKAITAFSFTNPAVAGVIDEASKTISVSVSEGTNVKTLIASFTSSGTSVTVGSALQASGVTPNDFTSPVVYTVKAEDNSTVDYTVTVTIVITPKAITSFSFESLSLTGIIDDSSKTIIFNLADTLTDVTALVATFTTTGASVSVDSVVQVSGTTPNNFTSSVVYTVSGTDGTTAKYTVYVMKPAAWIAYDWTTVVEPPTGWTDRESMGTFCTVTDGILSFNSDTAIANQAHYRYTFSNTFTVGSKMTVACRVRADGINGTYAWVMDFQNVYRGQLEIKNGKVTLMDGSGQLGSVTVSSSEWHTYFISYEVVSNGLQMKVFIDGKSSAALSGIAKTAATGTYIRLGDMSKNYTYMGSIDWIFWALDGAYAPGVILPTGYSLIP